MLFEQRVELRKNTIVFPQIHPASEIRRTLTYEDLGRRLSPQNATSATRNYMAT
jgi:uncharacterized protein (DUF58 family)